MLELMLPVPQSLLLSEIVRRELEDVEEDLSEIGERLLSMGERLLSMAQWVEGNRQRVDRLLDLFYDLN